MTELSYLDAAETFSGEEAATLVVGLDPLDPQADMRKIEPVLARMVEGHRIARALVSQPMTPDEFKMRRKNWPDALVSVLFDLFPVLQKDAWPSDPNRPYELPNRFAGPDGEFKAQKFDRAELHRWLSVVGLKSSYQFQPEQANDSREASTTITTDQSIKPDTDPAGLLLPDVFASTDKPPSTTEHNTPSYPWGEHNTYLLTRLSEAAIKFWSRYDPSDRGTAPTNEQIEGWLKSQGVSKRTAEVIATILRADDLPTGRRE